MVALFTGGSSAQGITLRCRGLKLLLPGRVVDRPGCAFRGRPFVRRLHGGLVARDDDVERLCSDRGNHPPAAAWTVTSAMAAHLPRIVEAFGATPAQAVFAGMTASARSRPASGLGSSRGRAAKRLRLS